MRCEEIAAAAVVSAGEALLSYPWLLCCERERLESHEDF